MLINMTRLDSKWHFFATADGKKAFDCDKEQPRERDNKINLRSTSENHILNAKVIFDLCT